MSPTAANSSETDVQSRIPDYVPDVSRYDEMVLAPGTPRPHWCRFVESLGGIGATELSAREEEAARLLKEHGVTYNIYGDDHGMERPWGLDVLPLLLDGKEWATIESGLKQRSLLLNRVLSDVYGGAQRLLRDGFLPPELVYANPGFLRPCRGLPVRGDVYLHFHGCDLARSQDGAWWVLSDRTQAPSGAGYALENRSVISRILPEQIRESKVRRLPDFFRRQRDMLMELAPEGRESPHVVLLTPGPHNETYFEHAYLARNLGYTLVEGADLTVRDRCVFLKTLEGLHRVDVIVRRVDDSFCDPLELRADSFLGAAGMVEAARAGNVTLANALGSGLLEAPAFLAFMGGVCRHLLGEELILPSVATWWCGQAEELRYVLDHLDELVIKPAFTPGPRQHWFGGALSRADRTRLAEMIQSAPEDFVGQERSSLSRAPIWKGGAFESRSVVLRTYVIQSQSSFAVLPGGLTRVSRTPEDPVVTMQSGGGSKDTWVVGDEPDTQPAEEQASDEPRTGERPSPGIPSRAADNLFWLGRYIERLEQTLRSLRCLLSRMIDETQSGRSPGVRALTVLLNHLDVLPRTKAKDFNSQDLQKLVLQQIYKTGTPGGIQDLLTRIRFAASAVRDRFSGDTWRILGRLDADAKARPGRLPLASAQALVQSLILDLAAFNGMEMENMTRGHGWRFLNIGRRVERGVSMLSLLESAILLDPPHTQRLLEPVLEIADSVMTYRRRHCAEPRLEEVLELLMRDGSNPRSVAFQLQSLLEHSDNLPSPGSEHPGTHGGLHIAALQSKLAEPDLAVMAGDCLLGRHEGMARWFAELSNELARFSDDLTTRYFSHSLPRVSG